jgi:flavodoxin
MKTMIVCVSLSHGNTKKVARAIGEVLDARVVEPEEVTAEELATCDLVGFGSGIYAMAFHPRLRRFVRSLPPVEGQKAFVFATSGSRELWVWPFTGPLRLLLESKGYDVVDTFSCRGFDTLLPLRLVGGINKGRPNAADLDAARAFAATLRDRVGPSSATSPAQRAPAGD